QPGVTPMRVVSYGHSLGSAPAIHLAATVVLRALVVESGFESGQAMANTADPLEFPVRWLLRRPLDNLAAMRKVSAPVLVLHGTADRQIPVEQGRALYAAAAGQKQLSIIEGAGHDNVPSTMGTAYGTLLRTFLNAAAP